MNFDDGTHPAYLVILSPASLFERLNVIVSRSQRHAELVQAKSSLPQCTLADATCKEHWRTAIGRGIEILAARGCCSASLAQAEEAPTRNQAVMREDGCGGRR